MNIYIEDGEFTVLPQQYHKVNNICAIIYDQITEIFSEENYKELRNTSVEILPELKSDLKKINSGEIDLLQWLKQHNYNPALTEYLTKNITFGIMSDFANFIFESLSNAKRGKMSVAYALLRKPMIDELLILEQLLVNRDEFIDRYFHDGDPKKYDTHRTNKDKALPLITDAINKLSGVKAFSPEMICDYRYDKAVYYGINGKVNQALHIVTSDKNYATANSSLNFIFSTEDDTQEYWHHYYKFLPYLLIYAAAVIDEIIFSYLPDETNRHIKAMKSMQRLIAINIISESGTIYDTIEKYLPIYCYKCKEDKNINREGWEFFFANDDIECPKCKSLMLVDVQSTAPIKAFIDIADQR